MKMNELRQKSQEELAGLLTQRRERIAAVRFLLKQKKVKNVKEAAMLRKDVARILTIFRGIRNIKS
ncbi:MAG: 50S ribosomal protein L29 [Candidatus Sungiibacteriota bacterium]